MQTAGSPPLPKKKKKKNHACARSLGCDACSLPPEIRRRSHIMGCQVCPPGTPKPPQKAETAKPSISLGFAKARRSPEPTSLTIPTIPYSQTVLEGRNVGASRIAALSPRSLLKVLSCTKQEVILVIEGALVMRIGFWYHSATCATGFRFVGSSSNDLKLASLSWVYLDPNSM